ncbi:MAG: phosphoribosylformylglycinamidine cyclo-ligase, partial [Bacteroidetes bacterium]|nr:phosphoribosylformylglycinamidine cyclo-ligase [Bacteroidota bacterium]
LLSSTIGRNKNFIPGEVIAEIINGTEEFIEKMSHFGIGIHSTGGETADIGDLVRTIVIDSTLVCRMKRHDVISNHNIRHGDVIVGLASDGKATYEDEYNGGTGSNGLTSARHDMFKKSIGEKYPESFDNNIPEEVVYTGNLDLTEIIPEHGITAGKLLLSPTRTYAPIIKTVLDEYRSEINGMVHCSGGAQTKVLNFVNNLHVVKNNMFPLPTLFKLIHEQSGTSFQEMYKVFNMGHRFEVYTSEKIAEKIIEISKSFGVNAQIIGYCENANEKKLTINSEFGEFVY